LEGDGEVFLCLDTQKHNNRVSAKRVLLTHVDGVRALQREIKLLKWLKSDENPHILIIIDEFEWKDHLCMITEYCEGGNLADYTANG
jgi:serine/threonine protein kinase